MYDVASDKPMKNQRGMTVVELVVVLVLTGILAAVVIPRFMGSGGYAARAAQDRLIAAARYAQEVAMNKGPGANVQLKLDGAGFVIDVGGNPITLPMGGTRGTFSRATTTAATVSYNALGGTSPTTITVKDSEETRHVCIEATGYAHGC